MEGGREGGREGGMVEGDGVNILIIQGTANYYSRHV